MNASKSMTLICLLAFGHVMAASFDCNQAASPTEKIICRNQELSELDTKLGEAYKAAKQDANEGEAKRLAEEQRHWLRVVRNRCADAACLRIAYESRLNELDPFADNKITCEEMKKYPKRIFTGSIDLGSGSGSPIEVDYRCSESLDQQKFMKALLDLAETIRGDGGPQICTGSIVHALWRYYHFSLAAAGFSPTTLTQNPTSVRAGMDWDSFARADGDGRDALTIQYFKQWSEESRFNRALYADFTSEFDRALPALVKYYEQKFGLPRLEAQVAANSALMLVVQRAAGSFPRNTLGSDSNPVQLARDNLTTPSDIRTELTSYSGDLDRYSESEIYQALRIALIHNRSLPIISSLANLLTPEALQRLGEGKEPLLSFAIGNQQNLEYLLSRKAPVDETNDFGKTALFYAIGEGNHKAVEALLRAGANVNIAYKSAKELRPDGDECRYWGLGHTSRTPLMHAAQNSDVRILKLLIQAGAHLDAVDDLGYGALDFAVLGKNKDNETYLRSLGLEFGAPKYKSDADPAVREQKVQEAIAIDGYVSKLLTAAGRPDILVAAVHPWDTLVAGAKHGLYLISLANPDHPKVISNFPAVYANDFALSLDGKRAYVMEIANDKAAPNKKFGIDVINIENPEKPTLAERIEGDFMTMHLSPDENLLYVQERKLKPEFSRGLLVFSVGSDGAKLKCSNPFGNVESFGPIFAYSFASFPDERLLLIHDQSRRLILFDVKDPCAPTRLSEFRTEDVGGSMFGAAGRTIVSGSSGGLQKFHITDALTRVAGYGASVSVFHVNPTTNSATAVMDKDVVVFRIKASGQFVLTDRFRPTSNYVGSVLQTDTGHVYMGWKGGLGVGNVPRE